MYMYICIFWFVFQARYPGRTLFLLFGLKDFPRTTLLYLYFFNYEDVFLPFVHFSTPQNKAGEPINWSEVCYSLCFIYKFPLHTHVMVAVVFFSRYLNGS